MAVTIRITVEDIAERLDDSYTEISLESASSPSGSYSVVDSAELASGTYFYEIEHSGGNLNTWYRYRFTGDSGAAPQSSYSNPFQPDGITRLKLRQYAIEKYDAGMVLASTTGGSTTTIVTNDYKFKSSVHSANRGKGTWINVTGGDRAGQRTMIKSSVPSTGTMTVDPAISGALGDGDQFEWHWLTAPEQWDAAINRGLARYYFLERVPIVGVDDQSEYDLYDLPWLTNKNDVAGLWHYNEGSEVDDPWPGNGRWYDVRQDAERITLSISPPIDSSKTLYLEAVRPMPPLHSDLAVAPGNCNLDLAAALAYDEVLAFLARPRNGSVKDRTAWEKERVRHHVDTIQPLFRKNPVKVRPMPAQSARRPVVPMPFRSR